MGKRTGKRTGKGDSQLIWDMIQVLKESPRESRRELANAVNILRGGIIPVTWRSISAALVNWRKESSENPDAYDGYTCAHAPRGNSMGMPRYFLMHKDPNLNPYVGTLMMVAMFLGGLGTCRELYWKLRNEMNAMSRMIGAPGMPETTTRQFNKLVRFSATGEDIVLDLIEIINNSK